MIYLIILQKNKLPFMLRLSIKKYCIAVSIVNHQILPAIFSQQFDSEINAQGFRNELSDCLSENLPLDCYMSFLRHV